MRAASSRVVRGVVPALVLAALLAGVLLGVARLLLAVVLPAESELQQFLADLLLLLPADAARSALPTL